MLPFDTLIGSDVLVKQPASHLTSGPDSSTHLQHGTVETVLNRPGRVYRYVMRDPRPVHLA